MTKKSIKYEAVTGKCLTFLYEKRKDRESIIKIVGNYNFLISINQLIVAALIFSWSYFFVFCVFLCAVGHMQKEWGYLAESISTEPSANAARYCSRFLFTWNSACFFYSLSTLHVLYLFCFSNILTFNTAYMSLLFAFSSNDPSVKRAMEKVRKAINRHGVLNII